MNEADQAYLGGVAEQLAGIDRQLAALTTEVRARADGLPEETAESLLDRLDEMMDLLYLLDERLSLIQTAIEARP